MIRRFLQGMPTRPAFFLAAAIILTALGGYYTVRYQDCSEHAALREQVYSKIRKNLGGTVSLAEAVPFSWLKVSVIAAYVPRGKLPDCPLGWDWSQEYRRLLARQGALNMLVFNREDQPLDYIDFRNSQIMFTGTSESFTPQTALFTVSRQPGSSGGLVIAPVP